MSNIKLGIIGSGQLGSLLCQAAKKLNIKIHFWTINDASTINKLLDLNVNGIMTDDCVLLKELMRERGKWPQT